MKTNSCLVIVTALAVGTLGLLTTAEAGPLKKFSRFSHSDGERPVASAGAHQKAQVSHPAPAAPAPAGYPQYQLIDLGTLGGPGSSTVFPARALNNRGRMIAFANTNVPDPSCLGANCYIQHGILRQPNGNIIDLPFPAGIDPTNNNSLVGDMTAKGLMGGFVTNGEIDPLTDFPQLRPVVWGRNGTNPTDLGTFGGNSGAVNQINSHGDTVGMALNEVAENPDFASFMNGFLPAATQSRAFLWQGGDLHDLGTLGGNDAMALGINDAGTIYGMSFTNTEPNDNTGLPTVHPFLWKNGQMRNLGSLGGTLATPGSLSYGPWGPVLNQRGQAIGTSTLAGDEFWHAFLYDCGAMTDLGTLGGNLSEALAINEAGLVVGRADFSPDSPYHHAVVWRNNAINDLGVVDPCQNSTATSVNSAGDVVGGLGSCTDNPDDQNYSSAFLWQKGKPMADLNALVSPASDMHIEFATAINDRGEIVGDAYSETGDIHVILLVPTGENSGR